jgi:hypothetical protein
VHVCVGTDACPGTADFRPCVPLAIFLQISTLLKTKRFYSIYSGAF